MLRSETSLPSPDGHTATHFGTLLKTLRHRHGIRQLQVLAHLPGWTQTTYSRVENGEVAPAFAQLAPIYCALHLAGVQLTPLDRQQFLTLARARIEAKKTYRERKTDQEWDEVRLTLSRREPEAPEHEHPAPRQERGASRPRLVETRHLVGREDWFASVLTSLHETLPKKLVVLQGPVGIGKSSELHRIALHFLQNDGPRVQVMLCELPIGEREQGAESALDLLLGTLLVEVGPPDTSMQTASLAVRITFALECLEKATRPLLLLLDNAEQILDEQGQLASCWEQFLGKFLRSQHHASLVLATKAWPGWFEGERVFLSERMIPPLSADAGATLLQRLGLAAVAVDHLRTVSETVGGIPLCLEWVASLAQEPMWLDAWEESADLDDHEEESAEEEALTRRLLHLLEDASLFGGPIATKLKPMLERIIEKRLSAEAYQVLCILALTTIPLGKPALQRVCPRPRLLKELSSASLLVAYPHRVQLLPMVASAVRSRLPIEQRHLLEERLIDAYLHWLNEGKANDHESGAIIAELATLYLKHRLLFDAAQLLIRYGWLSFTRGYASRLARLAASTIDSFDWHTNEENECGGLLLYYLLSPFLGQSPDDGKRAMDYQHIYDAIVDGKVVVLPAIEVTVMYHLMVHAMNNLHFKEAQVLLNTSCCRLEPYSQSNLDLQVSLLEKRGWLFGTWCEYNAEQGNVQTARRFREQAINLYRQCIMLLSVNQDQTLPRRSSSLKKRMARALNNVSYHLNRIGKHEEALQAIEQSINLKEQGYVEADTLADAYGEKSEALVGLGRFREALLFDEKAFAEVQRLANTGYTFSQEEVWIYHINRGRLYLRLGRIDEAEQVLREALPRVHPERRMYRMFAKDALEEIEQWQRRTTSPEYQLDWRWVERYRELASFDAYWWLASTGPFTEEEQQQWDQLYTSNLDEATKEQLGTLLVQAQQRELAVAIAEQREPRLFYPALDITEVRRRSTDLLQLDTEIGQEEPHAIVRRLYHSTIEEELDFLHLIEATYEGNSEKYWTCNLRLNPAPTVEEMNYVLSRVRRLLLQGLLHSETAEASQRVIQIMHERLHLSLDLSYTEAEAQTLLQEPPLSPPQLRRMVTAQTVKRFFEAALCESGYEGWKVMIDPNAGSPRVEQGLRQLFLPDSKMSVNQVKEYLLHELAGHVSRCIAGEHSLFGLLGIHTKNSLETEEGLATYYERQAAALYGQAFDESGVWFGTLATGLASGVVTPPQTFLSLFTFFDLFIFLYRLLKRPDQTVETAQKQARRLAFARCLRTYRGVPDLEKAGVCYVKDALYLRGLWKIEQAVAHDETVLDRLTVGVVALDQLTELQELGIVSVPQPLKKLALDPELDSYIFSFEVSEQITEEHA